MDLKKVLALETLANSQCKEKTCWTKLPFNIRSTYNYLKLLGSVLNNVLIAP